MNTQSLHGWYVSQAFHPVIEKFERIKKYSNGWAFGEGTAYSADVICCAEKIIQQSLISGYTECDVFPGRNGQIIVTVYVANETFDFTVAGRPCMVSLTHEINGEEIETEDFEQRVTVDAALLMLGGTLRWPSSESFIQTNTRVGKNVLSLVHSSLQVMAPEFQFSNVTAPSASQVVSVHMQSASIDL